MPIIGVMPIFADKPRLLICASVAMAACMALTRNVEIPGDERGVAANSSSRSRGCEGK
jgi:hypothetical protein